MTASLWFLLPPRPFPLYIGRTKTGTREEKTIMPIHGEELIERCKEHVIATLRTLPECAPTGPGLRNKDIETACGFALGLPRQDGWFTLSCKPLPEWSEI